MRYLIELLPSFDVSLSVIWTFIYSNESNCSRDGEAVTVLTLSRRSALEIRLSAHLLFISIVEVGQVQHFNLMTDDKVLTPC